jgi:hypothetical protein
MAFVVEKWENSCCGELQKQIHQISKGKRKKTPVITMHRDELACVHTRYFGSFVRTVSATIVYCEPNERKFN